MLKIIFLIQTFQKGALQVSEKERGVAQDSLFAEIAEKVSEMSINTETEGKYPPTIIQKAMREEIHYSLQIGFDYFRSKLY